MYSCQLHVHVAVSTSMYRGVWFVIMFTYASAQAFAVFQLHVYQFLTILCTLYAKI